MGNRTKNRGDPKRAAEIRWEKHRVQYSWGQIQIWRTRVRRFIELGFTFDKAAQLLYAEQTGQGVLITRRYCMKVVDMVAKEWSEFDVKNSRHSKAKAIRQAAEAVRNTQGLWQEGRDGQPGRWVRLPNWGAHVAALDHLAKLEGTYEPIKVEVGRSDLETKFNFFLSLPKEKQQAYIDAAEKKLGMGEP